MPSIFMRVYLTYIKRNCKITIWDPIYSLKRKTSLLISHGLKMLQGKMFTQPVTSLFQRLPPVMYEKKVLLNLLDWWHFTIEGEEIMQIIFSWRKFCSHSFALTLYTNCYITISTYAGSTTIVTDLGRKGSYYRKFKNYQMRCYTFTLYYVNFCEWILHTN